MAESHTPKEGARDPNDEKVMATSPGAMPGRTIEASNATLEKYDDSSNDYYSFPSSKCVQVDTYAKRRDKIASFLGNKDEVKG